MAQFARPVSDVTTDWTTTPLWSKLDETSPDDGDFITGTGNAQTFEVKLSAVTDPAIGTGHVARIKAQATGGQAAEKLNTWGLYQGATPIVTSNQTIARGSFNEYSISLSEAQADAITDYSDLRIRGLTAQGAGETIDVSWAELEVPDASAPVTINAGVGGLALNGIQAAVQPGAVSISAVAGVLTLSGPQASIVPGAVSISAAVGLIALGGPQATVTADQQGQTVSAGVGTITLSGPAAAVIPGGVTISAVPGSLMLNAPQAGVIPGSVSISAGAGSLSFTGPSASIVPGGVSVAAGVGLLAFNGPQASITTGAGGQVINAAVGILMLNSSTASIIPGSVSVGAVVGTLNLTGSIALINSGIDYHYIDIDLESSLGVNINLEFKTSLTEKI